MLGHRLGDHSLLVPLLLGREALTLARRHDGARRRELPARRRRVAAARGATAAAGAASRPARAFGARALGTKRGNADLVRWSAGGGSRRLLQRLGLG